MDFSDCSDHRFVWVVETFFEFWKSDYSECYTYQLLGIGKPAWYRQARPPGLGCILGGGFMAQHEHTIVVTDKEPIVLTENNGICLKKIIGFSQTEHSIFLK
ncbi:hypothetical protein EF405_06160 [Cyclobacteriaceae bacterium YHN15]|nr:hypothetical protein EF405_06160 [Cyclobacteriaceae bacterium YHN15]